MSWSPAYFAAGEIIQGTISGLFFNLIDLKDTEALEIGLSRLNENPLLLSNRNPVSLTSESLLTFISGDHAVSNIYIGFLYIADKITPNTPKRILWVNTTKPLPAN